MQIRIVLAIFFFYLYIQTVYKLPARFVFIGRIVAIIKSVLLFTILK